MDDITVRMATLQDMEILLRFEQGVIKAERPFDITIQPGPIQYYNLEEMINAPHIHLVLAELNGQPVGSGYARIEKARHYLLHQQHAYLGFMYTHPQHRGKGINKKIIETLKAWAAAQNITELCLDVYVNNEPAIKAYEKAGFSRHLIQMRKGL
ncbi:MAG: GNAT family N-acetyltransferase [Chitinophagaceae bacterium]